MNEKVIFKFSILGLILTLTSLATAAVVRDRPKVKMIDNGTLRKIIATTDGWTCVIKEDGGTPSCTRTADSGTTCAGDVSSLNEDYLDSRKNTSNTPENYPTSIVD